MTRLVAVTAIAAVLAAPAAAEPKRFELDPSHTTVAFTVMHIGYAKTLGLFTEVSGSFMYDAEARSISDVEITVDPTSVFTNDSRRDGHVRDDDFLNVDEYAQITFTADGGEVTGENTGKVTGDLTVLGVTKPLTLDVTLNKDAPYPFGHEKRTVGVSARGTVMRSDYGMDYALSGDLVGDAVDLIIEFEAVEGGLPDRS